MEYDIIGGIVSPKAQKELDAYYDSVLKIAEAIKNMPTLTAAASPIAKGGGIGKSTSEFDAMKKAVDELVAARKKLTVAEQYDYQEVVRLQLERKKLLETYKQEALALDGKSKAQMQAAKESEKAAAAAKQSSKIIVDSTNYELQAMNRYYAELEKNSNAKEKASKATVSYKVNAASLTNVERLNATITSEHTSELQKMDAQMKLISLDLQKMVVAKQTESKAYTDGIAKLKATSIEYDRLSKASGATMMKTKSMYGSTFQLTQVMRELPNFAIDARIGFMALSNNLPMLADGFSQLKNEIDATTGKAYGFGGAAKIFAKSLLSLNTIMIVASTLLVLFGDDILDWINNTSSAEKANNAFIESIKAGNSEFSKSAEKFFELNAIVESAAKGYISAKDAVEEYNKAYGKTSGYVTSLSEAQEKLKKQIPDVLKALFLQGQAQAMLNAAVKDYNEEAALRGKIDAGQVTFWDKVGYAIKEGTKNALKFLVTNVAILDLINKANNLQKDPKKQSNLEKAVLADWKKQADEKAKVVKTELDNYFTAYEKFAKFSQSINFDVWGDEKQAGKTKDNLVKVASLLNGLTKIALPKVGDIFNTSAAKQPTPDFGGMSEQSFNDSLKINNERYNLGLLSYKDYLKKRIEIYQTVSDEGFSVQQDINNEQADIDALHELEMKDITLAIAQETVSGLQNIWGQYFDKYLEDLKEQSDEIKKIEDAKLIETELKEKAGVLTKTQAEEEVLRTKAYYQSVQEDLDEKEKKAKRDKFLLDQAAALATIWINAAVASSNAANLTVFGAFTPIYAALAAIQSAVVIAQSIPYFAEGGIMDKDGKAVLGDGGKQELAISPSGNFFISKDTPTMYNLEKGTQILPDVNKVDLMSILALKQVMPKMGSDKTLVNEMRNVTKAIQSQRQGNFYGMPLIKQLDNRSRYSGRNKSLMN